MSYKQIPKNIAIKVERLRVGIPSCTWRRISEIISDEHPDFIKKYFKTDPKEIYGHQWVGEELCKISAKKLKISEELYDEYWN